MKKNNPGKFEGCDDQDIGERLHEITMDGCCEDIGDVESLGWFAKVDIDNRLFIVSEDSQGFFDYTEYADEDERAEFWAGIEEDYAEYYKGEEA
jgi:hypothetical protein